MLIAEKTSDNKEFQEELKTKIKTLIDTSKMCRVPDSNGQQPGLPQRGVLVMPAGAQPQLAKAMSAPAQGGAVVAANNPLRRDKEWRKAQLAKLDQKLVDVIIESILDKGPGVHWTDI